MTRVEIFEVEHHGESYLVRSQSITRTCHWIINNSLIESVWDPPTSDDKQSLLKGGEGWLRYEPVIIARLDAQGQRKRRNLVSAQAPSKASQQLRTLGGHLDRIEARAFTILWNYPNSVTIDYKASDGQHEQRSFSFEKLDELGFHMRIRRSTRSA